jgi:hypothetical protein
LQEYPGSDRETIEPHSLSLSDFSLKHEITCTTYTKQMHNKKKTFLSITSIHRENNTNHELESKLPSINSNAYTWVFFIQYSLLALLFS